MKANSAFFLAALAILYSAANADPDPIQDFCVAADSLDTAALVNGQVCKNSSTVTADDFYFSGGLDRPGNITSPLGSKVTMVFERQMAGLNTLGVATARLDFAPGGLNPPHHHPRASEFLVVLEGTLYAGFVTSNPPDPTASNTLFEKILGPGDVFVFPRGLIHFQYNVGEDNAVAIVGFNSQNPGVVTVAKAVFGAEPPILPPVLAKAFQVSDGLVEYLQSLEWLGNN